MSKPTWCTGICPGRTTSPPALTVYATWLVPVAKSLSGAFSPGVYTELGWDNFVEEDNWFGDLRDGGRCDAARTGAAPSDVHRGFIRGVGMSMDPDPNELSPAVYPDWGGTSGLGAARSANRGNTMNGKSTRSMGARDGRFHRGGGLRSRAHGTGPAVYDDPIAHPDDEFISVRIVGSTWM